MKQDKILKCLIAFILGILVARMMSRDRFSVGGQEGDDPDDEKGNGDDPGDEEGNGDDPGDEEEPSTETINIDENEGGSSSSLVWYFIIGIFIFCIIGSIIFWFLDKDHHKTPTYIPKKPLTPVREPGPNDKWMGRYK